MNGFIVAWIWITFCFGLEANNFKPLPDEISEHLSWRKSKAYDFLHDTWLKNGFKCLLSSQKDLTYAIIVDENFSTAVIMELLLELDVDSSVKQSCLHFLSNQLQLDGFVYFFTDKNLYPPDADTMAITLSVLTKAHFIDSNHSPRGINGINAIINNTTSSGIIDTYFDITGEKGNRVDPVVCANALYAISLYGRESEAQKTVDFVYHLLVSEGYLGGTRYYESEDTFLYALSKLVISLPNIYGKFAAPLKEKVTKRIGSTQNPLDLAMRIIACNNLGLQNSIEKNKLVSQQLEDGSWPAQLYFKGTNNRYFGSKEISTAFALKALSYCPKYD